MQVSTKKVFDFLKIVTGTFLVSVLLASAVYVSADEALNRMQRSALRSQCNEVLSERARMMMGQELGPDVKAQVVMQCRQAIP